jgi:hypothetical protein
MQCSLSLTITAIALLALSGGTAGAGFSDLAPEPQVAAPGAPAVATSNPSPRKGRRSASHRLKRPKVSYRAAVLNAQIDPAMDPNWYLSDPTLRRGDMVVLENKVLVYDGPPETGPHMRARFADLQSSAVVSNETKKLVIQMTGLRSSSEPSQPPPDAVAVAKGDVGQAGESGADAPTASAAKRAVKPASSRKHGITVRTFAEAHPQRTRSYLHRKRVAYAARQTYRRRDYPAETYYSRPAYAPPSMTPFWEW